MLIASAGALRLADEDVIHTIIDFLSYLKLKGEFPTNNCYTNGCILWMQVLNHEIHLNNSYCTRQNSVPWTPCLPLLPQRRCRSLVWLHPSNLFCSSLPLPPSSAQCHTPTFISLMCTDERLINMWEIGIDKTFEWHWNLLVWFILPTVIQNCKLSSILHFKNTYVKKLYEKDLMNSTCLQQLTHTLLQCIYIHFGS